VERALPIALHEDPHIYYIFYNYEENHRSKATTKNLLNRTILYVHSANLLIRSSTQLDFPFYDFSATYYDFSKLLSG
jgi:hypothetical protein